MKFKPGNVIQNRLENFRLLRSVLFVSGEHVSLRWFKHKIEPPQYSEGQNNLAVIGLLVPTAQKVGNRPDKIGFIAKTSHF